LHPFFDGFAGPDRLGIVACSVHRTQQIRLKARMCDPSQHR
jgi:hypothetical protein